MSLIALGAVELDSIGHALWVRHGPRLIAETLKEPGCLNYLIVADPLATNVMRIVEEWIDGQAFEAHVAAPHVSAFRDAVSEGETLSSTATFYDAATCDPPVELSDT